MNTSMDFTLFTATVVKGLQEKMGESFRIFSSPVKKNNGIELTGIIAEEKNCNTSPTIYIDDFYENYQNGVSLEAVIDALYRMFYQNRFSESVDLSNFTAYPKAKKQIAYKVVNYEKNWELLKQIPHKVIYNLALVYYYAVQEPPFYGKASILIQNQHLENWGIDLEELHRQAMENTPCMFPAQIENIEDVMLDMLNENGKKGSPEPEDEKEISPEITGDKWIDALLMKLREDLEKDTERLPMYVLTNRQKLQGAACMFYPNVLKNFAENIDRNLFILPSSVHEVILLPDDAGTEKEALLDMVMEINRTQVAESEVLADSIYYYRKDSDKMERLC